MPGFRLTGLLPSPSTVTLVNQVVVSSSSKEVVGDIMTTEAVVADWVANSICWTWWLLLLAPPPNGKALVNLAAGV